MQSQFGAPSAGQKSLTAAHPRKTKHRISYGAYSFLYFELLVINGPGLMSVLHSPAACQCDCRTSVGR